jgi:hypothetical protein
MKKFLFSLLVGLIMGGLLYMGQYQENRLPENLKPPVMKITEHWHQCSSSFVTLINEHGLPLSISGLAFVIAGALSVFLAVWLVLSVVLGFRGFLRDFFSFFPLGK